MNTGDDRVLVPKERLSKQQIGHAGVKDLSEIRDYRVRQDGNCTTHTINFGEGSSLSITYSDLGIVLDANAEQVRFEKLGDSLFVTKRRS